MFASFTSFRAKALAMNRREAVMSSLVFSQIVWRDKCMGLIVMNNNFNEWLSLRKRSYDGQGMCWVGY